MIRANSSAIQPTLKLLKYLFGNIRIDPQFAYNGTPCWLWTTVPSKGGYGRFKAQGIIGYAHVAACRMFVGAIPEELSCDHLCRHRICANPAHIEFVPIRINILRGVGPAAINAKKTHCINGHKLSQNRDCQICLDITQERYRRKKGMRKRHPDYCLRGHKLQGYNVITDKRGKRGCRLCKNAADKDRRRKAREGQPNNSYGNRTHCKNGHPFDETNTFYRADGGRGCRICRNESSKRSMAKLPQDHPQKEHRRQRCRDRYHRLKNSTESDSAGGLGSL